LFWHKHLRVTHILVLTLAVVLASISVGLITTLHDRAAAGRSAELSLARVNLTLNQLVPIAFAANPSDGGFPVSTRAKLLLAERSIDSTLASLRRDHPNGVLNDLSPLLRREYRVLERILRLDSAGDVAGALALGPLVQTNLVGATSLVEDASRAFEQQASTALWRATVGSAAVIFILLSAFALFFRRSWVLLARNETLLEGSRHEALTDVLTGLGNRRALLGYLEAIMPFEAGDDDLRWALVLLDLDGFKHYNDSFGHPAGDVLLERLGRRLADMADGLGSAYRMGGDEFCVLARISDGDGDAIARRATAALSESGVSFEITCSYGLAFLPREAATPEAALRLADRRMYRQKGTRRGVTIGGPAVDGEVPPDSTSRQITDVLLRLLGERDPDLEEHLAGVGLLAQRMAERLRLPEASTSAIRLAAELHDVGKSAIPESILTKPGPLTPAEWAFMRRHTLIGERIVLAAPALEHIAPMIRSSHERVDGTGYPDGLKGHLIPLGARIIMICDAFDAMVTRRPYREPLSTLEAMGELRRGAATQFDAALITVFEQLSDDIDRGATTDRSRAAGAQPLAGHRS